MRFLTKRLLARTLLCALIPVLGFSTPTRVASFGPNGTHWPSLLPTPFMYDPSVANIIDVACTWTAIRNAILTVTPEMAAAGVLIRVAPGELPGNGSGATSTPVIQNVGSATWTKRVTVAPRDGYGTVQIGIAANIGARIHNVHGVCFAGFIARALRPSACVNSAIAWTKITVWLGASASTNMNSSNMEFVEVVLPNLDLTGDDNAQVATSTNGTVDNFQFIGCYFAPDYRANGSQHSDTLQFQGSSAYSNAVFRDTAMFSSSNCAIQTGSLAGLIMEHCYIAALAPALSRYPYPVGYTPPNPDDVGKPFNGGGTDFRIRDSILIGRMTGYTSATIAEVTNTRATQGTTVASGAWTIDSSLLTSTPEDFGVPLPTDAYLNSIWQSPAQLFAAALNGSTNGYQSHLPAVNYSGGVASLTFQRASANFTYKVEASSDLVTWTTLATNPGSVGTSVTVNDTPPANATRRFLRLAISDGDRTERTQAEGYLATPLPAGASNSYLGQALLPSALFSGNVTAVAASQLTFAGTPFTAGAFTSSPCWLRIVSGPQAGRVALITANDASSITVNLVDNTSQSVALNAASFSVVVGNTVEIVPADTLDTLFTGLVTGGNSLFTADTIGLWDGTKWVSYYRSTTTNSWLGQTTGSTSQNNLVIAPQQAWVLTRRAGRPATTLVLPGIAPESRQLLRHAGAGTAMTTARFPVTQTLASFAFTGPGTWVSNDAFASADTVSLWSGTQWVAYWRTSAGEWRRQGDTTNANHASLVVEPGRAVSVLRRAAATGNATFVSQPLPYSDTRHQ
ncbi:hypothetical protein [Oleiharenicola lentus]|uniref:hypothetical protein n=1 Tax=Oleiharenicola lentus TaxID=2508720 RepID=UPI003F662B25